jgi:iron complex transport system ATP-binding protein
MGPAPGPAVELKGIRLERGGRTLIDNLSWTVPVGSCAALIGPNGAGKSTLLSILSGFTWPQEGTVKVLGNTFGSVDLIEFRERLGFSGASRFPQFHDDMTALETVLAGLWGAIILPPRTEPTKAQAAAALRELATVGLADRAAETMEKLSTGEQARVLLARALVAGPDLLVLDEPTNSLDMAARAAFTAALERLAAERPGLTILIVTHHVDDLPACTDHVLLLAEGRAVAAGAPATVLTAAALTRIFGADVDLFHEAGRFWTRVRPSARWRL